MNSRNRSNVFRIFLGVLGVVERDSNKDNGRGGASGCGIKGLAAGPGRGILADGHFGSQLLNFIIIKNPHLQSCRYHTLTPYLFQSGRVVGGSSHVLRHSTVYLHARLLNIGGSLY